MKKLLFCLCILSLSFLACDEITESGSSTTTQSGVANQPTPETNAKSALKLEKLGQVVSCTSINKKIAEAGDATWVNSPFQVALQFAGDQMESRKKVVSAESTISGERFDELIVTVEEEGLLDDSIGGSMLIMRMEKKGATWEVTKASRVWKCWPGRGHVQYNSKPCS